MKKLVKSLCVLFCLLIGGGPVASEEILYRLVNKNEIYEIRYYNTVLIAEVEYTGANGGFGDLFNYISGANKQTVNDFSCKRLINQNKCALTRRVTNLYLCEMIYKVDKKLAHIYASVRFYHMKNSIEEIALIRSQTKVMNVINNNLQKKK